MQSLVKPDRLNLIGKIMMIPMAVTTQVTSKFGPTVPSILSKLPNGVPSFDKTKFSMTIPEVLKFLKAEDAQNVVIVGIEAHVCVAQSTIGTKNTGNELAEQCRRLSC
jgi:hypothetical protein